MIIQQLIPALTDKGSLAPQGGQTGHLEQVESRCPVQFNLKMAFATSARARFINIGCRMLIG